MKIVLKLEFSLILMEFVYYGLFIYDIKIILFFVVVWLFKIFDISKYDGKCVYIEECLRLLYGLCYLRVNESLNEVYVFF